MHDNGGTGFWHEAYFMGGGIDAIWDDMPPTGLGKFAPTVPARGQMFSGRRRAGREGAPTVAPVVPEEEPYPAESPVA